jgi:hypothetical protein
MGDSGTAIGIAAGAIVVLVIAFKSIIGSGRKIQARNAASAARSIPGVATVAAATAEPYSDTNTHFPYSLDLVVRPDGAASYECRTQWMIGPLGAAQIQIGNDVPVMIDPADPRLVRPTGTDLQIRGPFEHQVLKGLPGDRH